MCIMMNTHMRTHSSILHCMKVKMQSGFCVLSKYKINLRNTDLHLHRLAVDKLDGRDEVVKDN